MCLLPPLPALRENLTHHTQGKGRILACAPPSLRPSQTIVYPCDYRLPLPVYLCPPAGNPPTARQVRCPQTEKRGRHTVAAQQTCIQRAQLGTSHSTAPVGDRVPLPSVTRPAPPTVPCPRQQEGSGLTCVLREFWRFTTANGVPHAKNSGNQVAKRDCSGKFPASLSEPEPLPRAGPRHCLASLCRDSPETHQEDRARPSDPITTSREQPGAAGVIPAPPTAPDLSVPQFPHL